MSVKKCIKCGSPVNGSLQTCPECGMSLQDSNRSYKKVVLFALILFNVLMILWMSFGYSGSVALVEGANTVASERIAEESAIFGGSMMGIIWIVGNIVLGVLYFMSGKKK